MKVQYYRHWDDEVMYITEDGTHYLAVYRRRFILNRRRKVVGKEKWQLEECDDLSRLVEFDTLVAEYVKVLEKSNE